MASLATLERLVRRMLAPVHRRARLMILRGVVNLVDDAKKFQELQLDIFKTTDGVEHLQPLGLTSVPKKDAECVVIHPGGNLDHPVAIGVQDRSYRPTDLNEGETEIYSAHGNKLLLNSDGNVVIENSSGKKVTLNGSTVHLSEDPASDFIALAAKADLRSATIETALNFLVAAYNFFLLEYAAHTHTTINFIATGSTPDDPQQVTDIPDQGPSLNPGVAVIPAGSTAAPNVKAT